MQTVKYNDEDIIIYEYGEAEELIKELADIYKDNTTKVSRGGRGRNTIEYYNYACAFDIETTTIKPGELDYIGTEKDPPVAFPYLFQYNIYGRVIIVRQYSEALDVFGWIAKYFKTGPKKRLIIFDHNAGYEAHFFSGLWDLDVKNCFALDEHHPVTIVLKNGLMIRDSYKMSNMSLETLTKDWSSHYFKNKEIMDYSQLRTPYTILDHNTLLYSALDVLALSDAISNFLKAKNEPLWTRCPTSTSFVRANLKKEIGIGAKIRTPEQEKYFDVINNQIITAEQFLFMQKAARGGNTHANRQYTGLLLKDLLHFDICSAHPAQMVCYPEFPVGVWRPLDIGATPEDVELFEKNGYCCMFEIALINPRVKDNIPVPYISISKMQIIKGFEWEYNDNGRYLRGLEAISVSIFGIEWPIIKSQYDFDDAVILKGWFSYKNYLPDILRRFILDLYAKKTELKGVEGKEIEYALAKTYINGVFGMAYTSPIRQGYIMTNNEIIPKEPEDINEVLTRYQKSTSYFMPYCWGMLTATLTRCYLQKMIDVCIDPITGKSDFVYCDTDSIFAIKSDRLINDMQQLEQQLTSYQRRCGLELTYYDIKGKPHELGSIDREPDADFMTWGAKKYITVENGILKCTIAGVPKKKGAEIIGSPDNFKLGLNFKGSVTGKNCLWYNGPLGYNLHDKQGREIQTNYNIAMLPCDYLLDISQDYRECLSVEGAFHWNFTEADKNVLNEE